MSELFKLHALADDPSYETFFVRGGYDEKEAEIQRRLQAGYTIPARCWQTCVFAVGYYVTMIPPNIIDYQI